MTRPENDTFQEVAQTLLNSSQMLFKIKCIKTFTCIPLADSFMQSMSQNDLRLTSESLCDVEVFNLSDFEAVMTAHL